MGGFIDEEKVKLTDLLTVEELQRAQDAVSKMARVAVIITDDEGKPVTAGSNFTDFCEKFCRQSEEGRKRCEACDMMGAMSAHEQGKPVFYYCHANLVDFAAPIMLNGRIIGSFIGGQVLAEEPDYDRVRQIANEIDVDEDEFVKAASDVPIVPEHAIKRCTEFIYEYAQILSSMASKSYMAKKESEEALKAATAKTDFLANMSHEIRTPMNAIIGMSEIALREEMSPRARDYLRQVSNSAGMLLTIINDILDYSKLDAGKMSIVEANYSPAALLKDVGGIIVNRIGGKDIEYIVDVDTSMPCELIGDDIRLKQILVNLANNAVKFTNEGQIKLKLDYKNLNSEEILLRCAVSDTGIGIKKEDVEKLFKSFEQVDSKRNRKVEGTGLGLAIVKELVSAMGGEIKVESEYGMGSTFSFEIPQKVSNRERLVKLIDECPSVIGVLANPYFRNQIRKDMESLGAQYIDSDIESAVEIFDSLHVDYGITDDELTNDQFRELTKNHTHTIFFVICGDNPKDYSELPNVKLIRRPVSVLTLASVVMDIKIDQNAEDTPESELDFTAPDARVLIVDDNEVNLSVAEGLLEPLNMHIDTADGGKSALELIAKNKYDLVFMDHMMPDMDGIETTMEIRKNFPQYYAMPIIALTANALASSREELLMSGMNDFVAKPIVLTAICGVIKKWLPKEKILDASTNASAPANSGSTSDSIIDKLDFLNTKGAIELLKTEKLYMKVLKDYYNMIDKKHDKIKECFETKDIKLFTVEVHALKSSSKQIGADKLSEEAKDLEAAGNSLDMKTIERKTRPMLEMYLQLKEKLTPFFGADENSGEADNAKNVFDDNQIKAELDNILASIDELDLDKAEEIVDKLLDSSLKTEFADFANRLKDALTDMDLDGCTETIDEWKNILN